MNIRHLFIKKSTVLLAYTIALFAVATAYYALQLHMTLTMTVNTVNNEEMTYAAFILGTWLADGLMVCFTLLGP